MSAKEIRKLRFKFIRIAMISFSLVAVFVVFLINFLNYIVTEREISWTLTQLTNHQEAVDEKDTSSDRLPDAPSAWEVFFPYYNSNAFYILTYDEDGNELSYAAGRSNKYSDDSIRKKADEIVENGSGKGRSGLYYYQFGTDEDGDTMLVILDCSETVFARMRLMYTSIAVGIAALVATLILVFYLSKKMIEPEIEMSKKQMQFLTDVSHELKTPLAVIRSNAEMEEIINGENEWTQSTIRQVDRMNGLIKSLVMVTKLREQEDEHEISDIDISAVVRDTAKEFQPMAETSGKGFGMNIEDGLVMTAEESKIRQLLMILLDNAVKYCDEGGNIAVSLEGRRRGRIRLEVSNDYAEGSSMECERFFDRFYREDESHNIDSGGYGIGLNIAESICEQSRGSIRSEWNEGRIRFICEF